jgi:hypothetical protein
MRDLAQGSSVKVGESEVWAATHSIAAKSAFDVSGSRSFLRNESFLNI